MWNRWNVWHCHVESVECVVWQCRVESVECVAFPCGMQLKEDAIDKYLVCMHAQGQLGMWYLS